MDFEKLLKKCVKEDGMLDMDAAVASLKSEVGKEFVAKADFNAKNTALKEAEKTIDTLKENNANNEALQQEIADWKAKAEKAETQRKQVEKDVKIKEALRKAGGTDVDYLAFKLGDVELLEDGTLKDFSSKVEGLKKEYGNHFKPQEDKDGFKTLTNQLQGGNQTPSQPKTIREAIAMKLKEKENE